MCMLCFLFKQKTAYEMRISDWSSDVCSSDLAAEIGDLEPDPAKSFNWDLVREASRRGLRTLTIPKKYGGEGADVMTLSMVGECLAYGDLGVAVEIGRASCRESVCQFV